MNTNKQLIKDICQNIITFPLGRKFSLSDISLFRNIPLTINNRMSPVRGRIGTFIKANHLLLGLEIQDLNKDGSLQYIRLNENDLVAVYEKIEKIY